MAYVVQPGWYFVHRLQRLVNLRPTREELKRGEDAWDICWKKAEVEKRLEL